MAIAEVAGNTPYEPKYGYIALSLLFSNLLSYGIGFELETTTNSYHNEQNV